MIHLTNWIINGLPERFPKLQGDLDRERSGLAAVHDAAPRSRIPDAPVGCAAAARSCRANTCGRCTTPRSRWSARTRSCCRPHRSDPRRDAVALRVRLAALGLRPAGEDRGAAVPVEQAKRNILGLNAARAFGFEVPAHKIAEVPRPNRRSPSELAARPVADIAAEGTKSWKRVVARGDLEKIEDAALRGVLARGGPRPMQPSPKRQAANSRRSSPTL